MRAALLWFLVCSSVVACGGDKASDSKPPSGPIVSVLELPVSLRAHDAAPSDAHAVEISPGEIHLAGAPVITLVSAAVPATERQGDQLPKLAEAFGKAHHSRLALSVASSVPYETVSLVLSTAKAAGVRAVSFNVRAPGNTSGSGWLALDALDVGPRSKSDQEVALEGVAKRPWSDFANQWETILDACRTSSTGTCAYKPEQIAQGGDLKIVLHAAGQGVSVDFFRIGGPPPEAAGPEGKPDKANKTRKRRKVALIEGVKRPKDLVAEVEQAPPATEASFQFRAHEALTSPSAISQTIKPLCGNTTCGVVVQADKATLFVRVISLLGAAFPDGTKAPRAVFELP